MNEHFKTLLFTLILSLLMVNEVKCNFKFLLLHTNDMHSNYKEVNRDVVRCQQPSQNCFGGFARVRAAVQRFTEEAKRKGMPTLYLDAGNVFQGTVFYTEFKWRLAVKMMNLLKPQAMTLGYHEFDDGIDGLAPFVKDVNVPIVSCNIDTTQEPSLQIPPSIIITLGDEPHTAKIGIVGYLSKKDMARKQLKNVKILDEIESLNAETKRLREKGKVDIIIALSQSGYEMDKIIAKAVSDIDVIVGGHSHTFLYNGRSPSNNIVRGPYPTLVKSGNNNKQIPIVQASYGTKYLGYLELEWDDKWKLKNTRGLPVLLTGEMEQDNEVLEALKTESDVIAKKYRVEIGKTEVTLLGRYGYCRTRECSIGNMIADAFVDYVNTNYKTDNDKPVKIGLINAGAIKGSLFPKTEEYTGKITLEDVLTVLPYNNSLEVLQMKGSDLRFVLESSVDKFDLSSFSGLTQVSGLRLKYDLRKGKRLVSVKVAAENKEMDDNAVYNVVMTDYMAQRNDVKTLVDEKKVVSIKKEGKVYTAVEDFIKKHKTFEKHGKYSKPEGRIYIHGYNRIKGLYGKIRGYAARLNPSNGLRG